MSSSRDNLLTKHGFQGSMSNHMTENPRGYWTKHIRSQFTTGSQRTQKYFFICIKKEKNRGCSQTCQDLLSRVTLIAKTFGRMWSFDTKIVAVSLIMISHMRLAINVYQICRNAKAWERILKHQEISKKDVPIILRNMVSIFCLLTVANQMDRV